MQRGESQSCAPVSCLPESDVPGFSGASGGARPEWVGTVSWLRDLREALRPRTARHTALRASLPVRVTRLPSVAPARGALTVSRFREEGRAALFPNRLLSLCLVSGGELLRPSSGTRALVFHKILMLKTRFHAAVGAWK